MTIYRREHRSQTDSVVCRAVRNVLTADPTIYARSERRVLADGVRGTDQTLSIMRDVAEHASKLGLVVAVASAIVAQSANRDVFAAMLSLDRWLRETVKFKADTLGAEVLRHPLQLLSEIKSNGVTACDCDEVATMAAAIIRAMGHQPYFVVYRREAGGPFVHVAYAVSINGSAPIPFDPQERVKPGQWTHPMASHRKVFRA